MLRIIPLLIGLVLLGGCAQLVSPAESPSITPQLSLPQASTDDSIPPVSITPQVPGVTPTIYESPIQTPAVNESPLATPPSLTSPIATPQDAQALIDKAKNNLARQLDVSVDQIQFVSYQAVDWPDASIGCPKRGVFYAQTVTPGYQIVLEANGQSYEYHGQMGEDPFLCEK